MPELTSTQPAAEQGPEKCTQAAVAKDIDRLNSEPVPAATLRQETSVVFVTIQMPFVPPYNVV